MRTFFARADRQATSVAPERLPRGALFSSIRTKLLATVLLASAVAVSVGVTAIREITLVSGKGETIYTRALVPNETLSKLRETVVQARFDVVSRALAKSAAATASANADLTKDELTIDRLTARYAAIGLTTRQAALLKSFDRSWAKYKSIRDDEMTPALLAGNLKLYEKIRTTQLLPVVGKALGALNSLSTQAANGARAQLHQVQRAKSRATWGIFLLLAIGLLLFFGLCLVIYNAIMRPVRAVRDILDSVAQNDLTKTAVVHSTDELGQMAAALNMSISHLRSLHERLNRQALSDSLTGIPNRAALIQSLNDELLDGSGRSCLLFVDLDGFKSVNDTAGHAAGDALLVMAAARIGASLRTGDVVARLGGDEFLVHCRGLDDPSVAIEAAERIIARLSQPFRVGSNEFLIGASIGIAMSSAESTADTLIHQADLAMYRSKLLGKGRYTLVGEAPAAAA